MSKQLEQIHFFTPVQSIIPMVEDRMRRTSDQQHIEIKNALEHLLSSGGKRVRVAVTLLSGRMLGAEEDRLVTLAAAIELLHTATLVHDDLIDGALLRRGIATLNSQWSPAATVLTGDYIFAQAAKLAAQTNSVTVMQLFSETLATIVNGEVTQLFSTPGSASRPDYIKRIYAKTASMFELATEAAGELSSADRDIISMMRRFGYEIGIAFQIVDDILDFTGEQASIGKPVANDLRQGVVTLPTIYYMEGRPEDPDVQFVLNGTIPSHAQMERVINEIRHSGAINQSMDEAKSHVDRAVEILMHVPENEERQALIDLAEYIVSRQV